MESSCVILHYKTKVSLTQVYGTREANGTNRDSIFTNGLGIGEDLQVAVNLQLSQPQQQHYERPSGTEKLGYDFHQLTSRSLTHKKITAILISDLFVNTADYNYTDASSRQDVSFWNPINKSGSEVILGFSMVIWDTGHKLFGSKTSICSNQQKQL